MTAPTVKMPTEKLKRPEDGVFTAFLYLLENSAKEQNSAEPTEPIKADYKQTNPLRLGI